MAAIRVSPGIYQVNGKTYQATTAAAAEAMAAKATAKKPVATSTKPAATKKPVNLNNAGKSVAQGVAANNAVSTADQQQNIKANNPNVTNDFGSQTTTQNADGTVSVNQSLSGDNKKILEQGQGLTQLGQQMATNTLGQIGGQPQYRSAINYDPTHAEDAVYQSLTRGDDQKKKSALNDLSQQLYNQGIQYNADPNSQYQQQMGDFNKNWDNKDLAAHNQATQTGLSAQNQFFNQNETQTANDQAKFSNSLGNVSALSNLGSGLLTPNFQPYQGANVNSGTPTDIATQQAGVQQNNRQLNISQQVANKAGSGGKRSGGGGLTPEQQDAADRRAAGFA
jgi:hypothetical protein